jgi:hypothetical protein
MPGDIFTATGAKVFIGPSVAATPANAAAYAALSYVEIDFVESIGEFGDESSIINFAVLGDGRQRKAKGARDAGALTVTVAHIADSDGHAAAEAAEATYNNYAFKITLPNKLEVGGTDEIQYFKGLVTSKRENVGGNDNVVRKTYNIAVNSAITVVEATEAP